MANYADFDDTYVLSAAEVDQILAVAGNRAEPFFNGMAAGGQTTTSTPLTLAQKAQTYIITTTHVADIMADCGPRGHSLFTLALSLKAAERAYAIR